MSENQPSSNHDVTSASGNNLASEPDSTQSDVEQKDEQKPPKDKKKIILIIVVLLLFFAAIAFGLWKSYQPKEINLQGRVEVETIYVSSKVLTRMEKLYVHEGQTVKKGQELVLLSSPAVENAKKQAEASLQSALAVQSRADEGTQQENVETLYANWKALKAQAQLANETYKRGNALFKEGVISRQRLDEMQAARTSSQEASDAALQQYTRVKKGSTPQQKQIADSQVEIAKAALNEANAMVSETKLYAPVDGVIDQIFGKPSELISLGVPIFSILENDVWVSLNVREDQYQSVTSKHTIEGFIPALNKTARFKVVKIAPEGSFANQPSNRQSDGYDIRSFKFHLVPVDPIKELKIGMSVIFKVTEAE